MANGPFESYAPPGVYTRTQLERDTSGPPTGNRILVLIGEGRETLPQTDLELVRGSSASVDQRVVNEDVNDRFILDNSNPDNPILGPKDGSTSKFRVKHYPIVSGNGRGDVTNAPQSVTVTVDGDLVSPAAVDGERGVITLQVPPAVGADVRVTYFFNRTDTQITDVVSEQVTDAPAILLGSAISPYDIVADTNDVLSLRVDGSEALVTLTAGAGRLASSVVTDINAAGILGLTASVDRDNRGNNRIQLQADASLEILGGSANSVLGFSAGQKSSRNRTFYTYQAPIVAGNNGGVITTDPADVTVWVDGNQVVPAEVDGTNGAIILQQAPPVGALVEIRYYFNTWQDTFDYLPNTGIRTVQSVGISPGRKDFIEGNDYVVDENGRILWGSAVTIKSGTHTSGTEFFDDTQIDATLVDNRMYLEKAQRFVDRSVSPAQVSDFVVTINNVPTTGNGRNTPLSSDLFSKITNSRIGVSTHRPDLVKVYHGSNPSEALVNGAVTVVDVDPVTRRITVEDPIPPDHDVWVTYWYNRLQDDELTFEVLSQSTASTQGQYSILSQVLGESLFDIEFGTKTGSFTVQWPSGVESNPDAFITGTAGVNETVTVTFKSLDAEPAVFSNQAPSPYDIYENASDTLHVNVSGTDYTIDLSQAAFGVLVSESHADGSTYNIVGGTNDVFEFDLDGTDYSVTFAPDATKTGAEISEEISRVVPTDAVIEGTNIEDFTFTDTVDDVFEFTMNGVAVSVDFSSATLTASQVASQINSAIDATSLTSGDPSSVGNDGRALTTSDGRVRLEAFVSLTVDSGIANPVLGFTAGDNATNTFVALFRDGGSDPDRFLLRSKVTPAGPGDLSRIRVLDGSANETLGFTSFEKSEGTEKAVNKAATLLGDSVSSTDIASLDASSANFILVINGVEYTVDFTGVTITSVVDIATTIDTVITAEGFAVAEGDKVRITSNIDTNNSRIEIRNGSANEWVGFDNGGSASQRRPDAVEIAAVLNNDFAATWNSVPSSGFFGSAFADTFEVTGEGDYLRLTTFATGATRSFTFATGSDSVLNDTGIGIDAGDTATGADVRDAFDVASSRTDNLGSKGEGLVGQTYTDDQTGLRFTILESGTGDYPDGGSFTLNVSDTFETGSSRVVRAVAGTEVTVDNTTNVGVGDTAILTTYNKSGEEPGIGDFYYISYEYEKSDFSTRLFTRFRDIQRNFGTLSPQNPLTMASYLAILNGAVIVGCKQLLKSTGFSQASSQAYVDALEELSRPLTAGVAPDILVPLTSDPDVMGAYVRHSEIQSSQRFRQERRCVFGVASGTRPQEAQQIAQGLNSERAILVYPDSAIVTLTNELGQEENFILDGTYIAAALAGVLVSPQFDVATPLTRRRLTGFRRLNRPMDAIEMNNLAVSGVTVLEDRGTFLQVRDGLTTNVTSRFTSTPSIIAIQDFVQQQSRASLDRFIGLKFITGRAQDVEVALTGLLNSLVEQQIIVDFQGVRAEPDPDDPTMLRVSAFYAPVFPLKYIPITFSIGSSSSL